VWIGPPKAEASLRTVDLPAVAVAALKQHRARMLVEGYPHGLVFVNTAGRPIHRTHLANRSFRPLLKKGGLPLVTIHSLRHSAAVLCILQGVQPKVTQDRLGHKRIATTLDIYAHVTPWMKRAAAASLDARAVADGRRHGRRLIHCSQTVA
jgi:integrase